MVTHLSSKAKSDEVNTVGKRSVEVIDKSKVEDSNVKKLLKKLKKAIDKLTSAQNKKSGSDLTPLVQEFETVRDNGLKCLFRSIFALCFRLNDKIEAAAQKIKKVIKRHGSTMYDLPQDEQTSKMASLFKELEQPDLVAALEVINMTEILNEAKQANQNYLTELGKRDREDIAKAKAEGDEEKQEEEQKNVRESVKDVRTHLDKILNYLDAIIPVQEDGTIAKLFNDLEGIVEGANATIKGRETRKKKGGDDNKDS